LVSESNKAIRDSLIELYGFRTGIEKYYIGETADISDELNKLIDPKKVEEKLGKSDRLKFYLHLREAKHALKNDSPGKMREELLAAISLMADDVVANFMLAQAFEILDDSNQAITFYKTSGTLVENQSTNLKKHIESQAKRVEEKGPRKRLPNPGLRYLPW